MVEFFYELRKKVYSYIYNLWLEIRGRQLKHKKFTIICNNCMAGYIYHRLHMQFSSPTINLWIGDTTEDYIRFLLHLKEYIDKDLEFIHDGQDKYPRAWLGDVKIGFNHYKNEDEAKEIWNRRKNRIFWEDIYVILYARNGINESDYQALEQCGYKNIAVVGDACCNGFITDGLRFSKDTDEWMTKINGVRVFERDFDYFAFLKK